MIKEKHVRTIGIIMSIISAVIVLTCILLVPKPFSAHLNTIMSIIIVIITCLFTMLMAVGIIMFTDYKHLPLLISNDNDSMGNDDEKVDEKASNQSET